MGGGGDSRIPSILKECISGYSAKCGDEINLVVRTYDFDPEVATGQISGWVDELKPSLVIGESLGALHALRIKGLPHILVSPALNAPFYFKLLSWLSMVPGVTLIFDRIYRPREGDRQSLHFTSRVLRKYMLHRKLALENSVRSGSSDLFYAFFGVHDHYMKSRIVSLATWKRYFGCTYSLYDGTHFMEEEFVRTILFEYVLKVLGIIK